MKTVINYGMRIAAFFFICGFGELLCRGLLTFTNNLSFQTILWQSFISAVLFSVLWLGIVFLIGRRVKMVLLPLVAFTILNTIVEVFVLARYRRRLGGGWITLVMTSSLDEVCSFIVSNLEILFWGGNCNSGQCLDC